MTILLPALSTLENWAAKTNFKVVVLHGVLKPDETCFKEYKIITKTNCATI